MVLGFPNHGPPMWLSPVANFQELGTLLLALAVFLIPDNVGMQMTQQLHQVRPLLLHDLHPVFPRTPPPDSSVLDDSHDQVRRRSMIKLEPNAGQHVQDNDEQKVKNSINT